MRFKGTLILLVVFLALGSFVYFYEIKGGEKREKAKETENQVWKLDAKNIQEIDLASAGQNIAAVRKNDKEWIITAPRKYDADSDELNRLADSASTLRREEVLGEVAGGVSKFGLDPAEISLRLKTRDGKEYAIDFGNNNPSGNNVYARIPNERNVFMVASATAEAFKKKVEDLRDRSVLSFEQPEVQTLSIKSSKGDIDLFKDSSDNWWFTGTDKRAADAPEVRGILNTLSMGRISEFFNENAADYVNTGLNRPYVDVRLTYGKDKAIKHLIIGSEKSALRQKGEKAGTSGSTPAPASAHALYLAEDESRPDLFFVEKELVDKLVKSPDDVRDKALVPFQRWDVDSIDLTNTKGSFVFTKSGGDWFLGPAKKKVKWDAINGILDALEKKVKKWIDKPGALSTYGLDKPTMRVVLKKGGTVMADCSFGNAAKDGGIYAQVQGDSCIKVADPVGLEILDKVEPDFVEPPPPPAAPAKK